MTRQLAYMAAMTIMVCTTPGHAADTEGIAFARPATVERPEWLDAVESQLAEKNKISVLIEFRTAEAPQPNQRERANALPTNDVERATAITNDVRERVASAARPLAEGLRSAGVEIQYQYIYQPLMLAEVSREDLAVLAARPDITAVHLNKRSPLPKGEDAVQSINDQQQETSDKAQLARTTVAMTADQAWAKGYRGQGFAVAILDDGIVASHEMFKNKIVAEACFSNALNDPGFIDGLCPGGVKSVIGAGSASQCTGGAAICDHGSHVAGIATGNNAATTSPRQGVAPDAKLVPIQVFTRDRGCTSSSACLGSYPSDQLAALDWLIANGRTFNVVAVNMSLGGNVTSGTCSGDSRSSAITTLRNLGILTVIAAGNDGLVGPVSVPGCIPNAVTVSSVGATFVSSAFANDGRLVDLYASGESVVSATATGTNSYGSKSGTSMAAPHVAGAVAVLKSKLPAATAGQIELALKAAGVKMKFSSWTWSTSRMDIIAAADALDKPLPPVGVIIPGFFPSTRPGAQSFIRIMNPRSAPSFNAVLTIVQDNPRQVLGVYGALAPGRSAIQISMKDVETALGATPPADTLLTIYADTPSPGTTGFAQHVQFNPQTQSYTNVTICNQDLADLNTMIGNVHTSQIMNAPSYLMIHNTSAKPNNAAFDLYDARTGNSLGLLGTQVIDGNGSLVLPAQAAYNALNLEPVSTPHVNFILRSGFSGLISHMIENPGSGVLTDMTPKCPI
ncbi:MAG: hypothetical protein EXR11_07115 [Rhodospirillaceae bacterium]|nr:hypothetical protein [Rhodospirillaceae bacterium]